MPDGIIVKEFRAVPGSHLTDKQAQRYGKYLYAHAGLGRRPVEATDIVRLARPERSPLHEAFEWDDDRAAEAYRLTQAREMVRSIAVIRREPDGTETMTRAFHHVSVVHKETGEQATGYVSERVVFTTPVLAEQVVARARRELESWTTRYQQYEYMQTMTTAVKAVLSADEE